LRKHELIASTKFMGHLFGLAAARVGCHSGEATTSVRARVRNRIGSRFPVAAIFRMRSAISNVIFVRQRSMSFLCGSRSVSKNGPCGDLPTRRRSDGTATVVLGNFPPATK
jgi:hypothetical protein